MLFRIVSAILTEIEESITRSSLLEDFRMIKLPDLLSKCIELIELLVIVPFPAKHYTVTDHILFKNQYSKLPHLI